MDETYNFDDRRKTITIPQGHGLLYDSDESTEGSEHILNLTMSMSDTSQANLEEAKEDEPTKEREEDTVLDQLRDLTPTKINKLLHELDDFHIESHAVQEDNQIGDSCQENLQQSKKGKATKVKKETKKTKGKKVIEFEQDDNEEPNNVVASKEETTKTQKLKRGQKETTDVDCLNSKDSNKAVVNLKSTDSSSHGVLNDKKPNKSKGKKVNELEQDDKEEPISTKVGSSKEENTKSVKPKRGQTEASDVDSNKALLKSKSEDSVPLEVPNDKKPNKSKKPVNGKGKQPDEKVNADDKLRDKETRSKAKIPIQTNNLPDNTATTEKNPPNKKKEEVEEVAVKEKSSKTTKKATNNETDTIKDSKTTIEVSHVSNYRTRANKNPTESKTKKIEKGNETVKIEENPNGRSRRNQHQTDQEVSKPKEKKTQQEKETVENLKKKTNSGKQKTIVENSENKENENKNTKVKGKIEPPKKENPGGTKNTELADKIVSKRVVRKNK